MDVDCRTGAFFVSVVVAFVALGARPLSAQVLEVGGGSSSLYQAGGGSMTVHAVGYDFTLGAGTVDGHLLEGARMVKATRQGTYIVGDDRIDFRLPTDLFDSSHYLLVRGVGFSGVRRATDIVAFAGTSAAEFASPFFSGARMGTPTGVLFLKKTLSPHWQLSSDSVFARRITQIEALRWTPRPKLEVAFAAGVGANQPFAAASLNLALPKFDVQAAYIAAGQQFHRATSTSLLLTEPDRGNLSLTYRPLSSLTLSGSYRNYLVPLYPTNLNTRSSIEQGTASLHLLGAQISGTVYRSTYLPDAFTTETNHAVAWTAMRAIGPRLRLSSSYFVSKPKGASGSSSFLSTLSETLTARLQLTESLSYAGGHTSANFGGEFLSNLVTLGASYETFYVPAQNQKPFQQALLVDVKIRLLGRLLVHGASYLDPTGHLRYTADGHTVFSRTPVAAQPEHILLDRYVLRGCVVDDQGAVVEGAAVLIDQVPVYTDSTGCFYMRERKQRTHVLRVVIADFLVAGNWQVTSMPTTITSTTDEKSGEATVVVTVRKVRVVSSNPGEPASSHPSAGAGGS